MRGDGRNQLSPECGGVFWGFLDKGCEKEFLPSLEGFQPNKPICMATAPGFSGQDFFASFPYRLVEPDMISRY